MRTVEGFSDRGNIGVHLRGTMLSILAAGSVFFPGLFLLSKHGLKSIPGLRWNEGDAVIVSARLVSSIQAIMASTAGYIISTSCQDIIEDQHWLTSSYILFAVPYFVYDIYAMFLCYWYKLQVKGHEVDNGSKSKALALRGYLRREFLMILHHVVMVTVCFPISVFWRQGKGDYFQGVMFLAELSTPSVCLGKILIQLYWFSLICRGAFRLFTGSSSRSRKPTASLKPDYEGHEPLPQSANGYSSRMVGRDKPTMSH